MSCEQTWLLQIGSIILLTTTPPQHHHLCCCILHFASCKLVLFQILSPVFAHCLRLSVASFWFRSTWSEFIEAQPSLFYFFQIYILILSSPLPFISNFLVNYLVWPGKLVKVVSMISDKKPLFSTNALT